MVWAPPERQYPALNASGTVASSHRHSTASHEPAVHVVEVGAAHKTVDVKAHEPTKVVGCASGDWFCIMVLVFVLASAGIVCISIYVYVPRSTGGVAIAGALLLIIAAVVAALWVVYVRRRHNRLHAAEEEATAAANAGVIRYVVDNPKTTCAICQGPLSAPCDKDHSILLGRGRRRSADRAGRSKRHSASVVEGKVPADALDEPASGSRRSARRSHTSHHMGKRHSSSRKHSHRKSDAAAKPRKRKSSSSSRGSVTDVMDICPIATGACGTRCCCCPRYVWAVHVPSPYRVMSRPHVPLPLHCTTRRGDAAHSLEGDLPPGPVGVDAVHPGQGEGGGNGEGVPGHVCTHAQGSRI